MGACRVYVRVIALDVLLFCCSSTLRLHNHPHPNPLPRSTAGEGEETVLPDPTPSALDRHGPHSGPYECSNAPRLHSHPHPYRKPLPRSTAGEGIKRSASLHASSISSGALRVSCAKRAARGVETPVFRGIPPGRSRIFAFGSAARLVDETRSARLTRDPRCACAGPEVGIG